MRYSGSDLYAFGVSVNPMIRVMGTRSMEVSGCLVHDDLLLLTSGSPNRTKFACRSKTVWRVSWLLFPSARMAYLSNL